MTEKILPNPLPEFMYIVTSDRVRSGKPPMKVNCLDYVRDTHGKPIWIKFTNTKSSHAERLAGLECCYFTAQEAIVGVNELADLMMQEQNNKISKLEKAQTLAKRRLEDALTKRKSLTKSLDEARRAASHL